MKCSSLIYSATRGKKFPKQKILSIATKSYLKTNGSRGLPYPLEEYVPCDGKMKINITIDSDGCSCCCSSSYLEITYCCDKCRSNDIDKSIVPCDQHALEQFMDKVLDGME